MVRGFCTAIESYRYLEIRADLSTDDPNVSPELSALYAEAEPAVPTLLRPDGTEFSGGVIVDGLPASRLRR